jgi:hypothetical protein
MAESFTCAACGKEHPRDYNVTAVAECRVCRRMHCGGCLDENNRCKACALPEAGKSK